MRAMFDRIAGVYDLMNSVMTAGLHHRWRARAADLARVGPGRPRARRRDRHRRPRARARAARRAGRRGGRLGLLRGDARARARARRRTLRFEWGNALDAALRRRRVRRRDGRLRRAQLLRPRPRAAPRWRASCGPAAASSCSRSRRRSGRRCRRSSALWFDRVVPLLGRARRRPRRLHATCRTRCKRFPAPERAGRGDGARRACATSAGSSPPAGSSRSTPGRVAVTAWRAPRPVAAVVAAGRRRTSRALMDARRGAPAPRSRPAHGAALGRARGRDDRRRRQAPAAAARVRSPPAPAPTGDEAALRAGGRGRAGALGDARPRRRARRRRAAPRARRRSSPPPGARSATATGDLLFSRAFAELAAQRPRRRRCGCCPTRSSRARRGRAAAARRRLGRRRRASSATCAAAS